MTSMEKGRVCIKFSGREGGKRCVVVNGIDDNFVEVVCQGRKKRRKCNVHHLQATEQTTQFSNDEEAAKSLE
jgi:large subunit ribosomal protein L14e